MRERYTALFLDYDGTLTPIVARPDLAKLDAAGKAVLGTLSGLDGLQTAIVSGRALSNVQAQIGIPELIYVGNHGLELHGPHIDFILPAAVEAKPLIENLDRRLRDELGGMKPVLIENKEYTLSVHYRDVPEKMHDRVKASVLKIVGPHLEEKQIVLRGGKKVWEIRPAFPWDKGRIVLWLFARVLAQQPSAYPVYLGDDDTDEDAFRALENKGLTVKITKNPLDNTAASYYLNSPKEALDFLKRLSDIKTVRSGSYESGTR